jgi:hypothetical protein
MPLNGMAPPSLAARPMPYARPPPGFPGMPMGAPPPGLCASSTSLGVCGRPYLTCPAPSLTTTTAPERRLLASLERPWDSGRRPLACMFTSSCGLRQVSGAHADKPSPLSCAAPVPRLPASPLLASARSSLLALRRADDGDARLAGRRPSFSACRAGRVSTTALPRSSLKRTPLSVLLWRGAPRTTSHLFLLSLSQ